MKTNTLSWTLAALIFLSVFGTIGAYYLKFEESGYSDDPERWGQFGDFVGGILNPILAILNLIVLTYLTIKIIKVEDNRNNWTLQELARPYADLHFNSDFEELEITVNNCGLGPMILSKITIERKTGEEFSNFYPVLKEFIIVSKVNPKIYTFHTGSNNTGIAKDKGISLLKICHNKDDDRLEDFKEFLHSAEDFLNEFKIKIEYNDMYNRKMPDIEEQINFPKL